MDIIFAGAVGGQPHPHFWSKKLVQKYVNIQTWIYNMVLGPVLMYKYDFFQKYVGGFSPPSLNRVKEGFLKNEPNLDIIPKGRNDPLHGQSAVPMSKFG